MAERIRELNSYAADDDDTSVNIVAHPGAVVNVRASRPDSDAPLTVQTRWGRVKIAAVLADLVAVGRLL